MTQTGKCDTCRQRKVKCDEVRPKCSSCKKKDRPCTYSYGKASAFIVQDPKQMTKHGRSKTTPIVYPLGPSDEGSSSSPLTLPDLYVTTERHTEDRQGYFQTLAPRSKSRLQPSKLKTTRQQRALEAHLRKLVEKGPLVSYQPSSAETTLIDRYVGMLGSDPAGRKPFEILGTWIQSIPSRIGSNRMLDLAVQFLVDSHATYREDVYSRRKIVAASKAKALKELQVVVMSTGNEVTYDVLLTTKLHYAAEALLGLDTMYHAIHSFGLAELLRSGTVSHVDDEHFWNFLDNTYADDVHEAAMTGRKSVYHNDFYLSATFPPPIDSAAVVLSPWQRASMAIMHVFIQFPHALSLVRNAISNPEDATALATAMSHLESLMQIDLPQHVSELTQTTVSIVPIPPSLDVADLMPNTLEFDSVQSMTLCTRFWTLQSLLCGLADTLYRYFPTEAALSLLPSPQRLRVIDVDSAIHIQKSLRWADSISQQLPLVSLRLHSPLQMALGPWHRTIKDLSVERLRPTSSGLLSVIATQLSRAERMKKWIINESNKIHAQWNIATIDEQALLEALESLAGEKVPDWLPVRIRFDAEDGEMVVKMDYERKTGSYSEKINGRNEAAPKVRMPHPGSRGQELQTESNGVQLPLRGARNDATMQSITFDNNNKNACLAPSWTTRPVDFIHSTGRNLCSTSGWWPETTQNSHDT